MGRRRKEKQKADPGIPQIPDSSCNSDILPFSSAPWGAGRLSAGLAIDAKRPSAEILNTRNSRRCVAKKEKQKADTGNHGIPDSLRNSAIYRPVAFRVGAGRLPAGVAIDAQHPTRQDKIRETAVEGAAGKGKSKADPGAPKIHVPGYKSLASFIFGIPPIA